MGKAVENEMICSRCKKRFAYADADVKVRKLYGKEIEEKCCPFCGSKSMSPCRAIHYLAYMASKHTSDGKN